MSMIMTKIKTKIFTVIALLATFVLIVGILGIIFINQLAQGSKGTIKDNYASVDYSFHMQSIIDSLFISYSNLESNSISPKSKSSLDLIIIRHKHNFNYYYNLESSNITEKGEDSVSIRLKKNYNQFIDKAESFTSGKLDIHYLSKNYQTVKNNIEDIYTINMKAILRRNHYTETTASKVAIYMAIISAISILISLLFLIKFPGSITKPINEITDKIKSISQRKYNQTLKLSSNDELKHLAEAFNLMALRLSEYEKSNLENLLLEKKRFQTIVSSIQDGILMLDENGIILYANLIALSLFNSYQNDFVHKSAHDIAQSNGLMETIVNNLDSQTTYENAQQIKPIKLFKNGKQLFYNIEIHTVKIDRPVDQPDRHLGYIVILKNITGFQERDFAKTNLIATISHELKTPLSSINISLKLLEDLRIGRLNSEQIELINSVKQQSIRLSKVVNELLDFSQVETGNIRLKIEKIRAEDIIELGVVALIMIIDEKNIQIVNNIQENLPYLKADLEKSVWVFVNILNNAIRYSPRNGNIYISIYLKESYIVFSIKDEGPGIDKEDQEKLFNKFTKVGLKDFKGSGLGLAISKEFVETQGGKIWIESAQKVGCTFKFTLPIYS